MRIKTFQGRSLEELLPQIKAELGSGAVIIGQRAKVQGGVAGFFGTKVVEVTAADRMPSDEQLISLEDQLMTGGGAGNGSSGSGEQTAAPNQDAETAALAERFAGAMRVSNNGGIDVTDDWDPARDAELASEYGRVLEHAASSGFADMDVPVVPANASVIDPMAQARQLADATHDGLRHAAHRVDEALQPHASASAAPAQTYAPPAALPRDPSRPSVAQRFSATIQDASEHGGYEPQAVPSRAAAADAVDAALRTDLGMEPPRTAPVQRRDGDDIADALDAAVELIDLKAMAALRNAMHASRRLGEQSAAAAASTEVELDVTRVTEQMARAGVDDDVVAALVDTAIRHRRPFGGEQDIDVLLRSLVEESIDVRTGFPRLGRAYRMALVGATSCGKTTIAAKLAHGYHATGMQVGIISIVAPQPGLAVVGDGMFQQLDVDVRYAATPDQAMHAVDSLAAHDLVIVDTPGAAYLDAATFEQVRSCLDAIGVDDVHVVLPLATSSRESRSLIDAFRPIGANRLVVSRIDESRYVGQLLNFGFRLGMPMTYLSEGPRTTADLRAASAREIAARILPTDHLVHNA